MLVIIYSFMMMLKEFSQKYVKHSSPDGSWDNKFCMFLLQFDGNFCFLDILKIFLPAPDRLGPVLSFVLIFSKQFVLPIKFQINHSIVDKKFESY